MTISRHNETFLSNFGCWGRGTLYMEEGTNYTEVICMECQGGDYERGKTIYGGERGYP